VADTHPNKPSVRGVDAAAIGVAAVTTLALVVPYYTRRPFWFDEIVSVEIAALSPGRLLEYLTTVETNMALYHGLLAPIVGVSGDEAVVRALSIAIAVAVLPFVYLLGLRLFDRRTAALAVLLLSVNVSFVGHARDARGYVLALLLVTASTSFLVGAVAAPGRRSWTLYTVTAGLAVWAHVIAGLVVAAHVAWLLLERRTVPLRRTVLTAVGVGALVLPLVAAMTIGDQQTQLDWLERPRLRMLLGLFDWYVENRPALVVYFAGGVLAVAAAVCAWRRPPADGARSHTLLLLWLGVPPVAAFVLSFAQPVFLYRYFLLGLPALVLLVASGLARIRPGWLGIAAAALAVALSVRTDLACQPDCKIRHDDFESASAHVRARARPDDAVLVSPPQIRIAYAHYLKRPPGHLLYPARWALIDGNIEGVDDVTAATAGLGRHPRVWLLTWWLPSEDARRAVARQSTLVDAREFPGNVRVEAYRPGR
jgi:hypothetical protein